MQHEYSPVSRLFSTDLSEIVTLARNIIGEEWFAARIENLPKCGDSVYDEEQHRVLTTIKTLGMEKIGWICSFASYWGIHTETTKETTSPCPPFINLNGFLDMFRSAPSGQDLKSIVAFPAAVATNDFIEIMEIIATATIIAFALDILWQASYREDWGKEY